jgi:outer membrane receptor for ferrienterochelin and colicins
MNLGTGFRVVNLFAEDHAFISGNRSVILEEKLSPEQSYSGTLNANYVFSLGKGQGTVDADLYYTFFTNAIFPDYSQNDAIIYRNLSGTAQTRGIALSLNYAFSFPFQINLGTNLMQAFKRSVNLGVMDRKALVFAPAWSGVITMTYNIKKFDLFLAYTANLSGPMALPEIYDLNSDGILSNVARPLFSKPFSIHNFQFTKTFNKLNLSFYFGVQNIFNYRQAYSPMSGYNDPNFAAGFSPYFDTSYSYSTLHGRELLFGLRYNIKKRN